MRKRNPAVLLALLTIGCLLHVSIMEGQQSADSHYSQGLTRFYDGDFTGAQGLFAQATAAEPNDPRPLYYQGLCQLRLGNTQAAQTLFVQASYRENTAKGRFYDVSSSLRRIQGRERLQIEETRRAGRAAWRKMEEQKQIRRFGETVDRQKTLLSQDIRLQKEGAQVASATPPAPQKKGDLPSFAPIRPYTERGETEVAKVPNLTDENNDEFEFFRDEIGRTSRSTAEQARLKELESRIEYANPMDRPAKDGQKFVNIYDPGEIFVDEEPFFGADDPDDAYKEFENSPVASSAFLLETMIRRQGGKLSPVGAKTKKKKGKPGEMDESGPSSPSGADDAMGMENPMMAGPMGPEGDNQQGNEPKPNDTEAMFKESKGDNPFAAEEIKAPNPSSTLNLFADDLGFTAKPAEETTPQGVAPMGPGMDM